MTRTLRAEVKFGQGRGPLTGPRHVASDIRSRGLDLNRAINLYTAIMTTLRFLLMVYQTFSRNRAGNSSSRLLTRADKLGRTIPATKELAWSRCRRTLQSTR
jgi:hypothetical protein